MPLIKNEAKTILNEVNSSQASVLKGYLEVAGKKANVIIANPNGIVCEGCGVINAQRSTFTTGNPYIQNGEIKGFDVQNGSITVSGKGMDNSQTDYTSILAKHIEINATLWANQELEMIAGENKINHSPLQNHSSTTPNANTVNNTKSISTASGVTMIDPPPRESDDDLKEGSVLVKESESLKGLKEESQKNRRFAVDVAELGGMYAGQIYLIGTKDGLGIRNAGHIGADAHSLYIDSNGKIVNTPTGRMNAKKDIALNAQDKIENLGQIDATQTGQLQAPRVENRGLINGAKTVIVSNELKNVGTGRIYGDRVAIEAKNLHNLAQMREETSEDSKPKEGLDEPSAVIAARERLDLGVGHLENWEHSLILSLGDLYIGGELDEQKRAAGEATFIENASARIEALGNVKINAQKTLNHNLNFSTKEEKLPTTYHLEYSPSYSGQRFSGGQYDRRSDAKDQSYASYYTKEGRRIDSRDWYIWNYRKEGTKTVIDQSDPAQIVAGKDLFIMGDLTNDKSQILAGGALKIAGGNFNNVDEEGTIKITDIGNLTHSYVKKGWFKRKRRPRRYEETRDFVRVQPEVHFDLGAVRFLENATISHTDLKLPHSPLYTFTPDAPRGYFIETDSDFTNHKKWLGSDYMFSALRYEPNAVQKRLGDGFYEQRLLNEQIQQLTGKRYLEGYTNDEEQYRALMESGIHYAKEFNLQWGVKLSAEQMAQFTENLVWMVEEEVTLPNGTREKALVPKVYLKANAVVLNESGVSSGALIAGNTVQIEAKEIKNSGMIKAQNSLQMRGENLWNSGKTKGLTVDLAVQGNLLNVGGNIAAEEELNLKAGKTLTLASTLSTNNTFNKASKNAFLKTQLDKMGSVEVMNSKGKLNLESQGSLKIEAATIQSAGEINANANTIDIHTLTTQNKEEYIFDTKNFYKVNQSKEEGSFIAAQGDITFSSQENIQIRQGNISSVGGNITLQSQKGNIEIEAGRVKETLSARNEHQSKGILNTTTETKFHQHQSDETQGSNIEGKEIYLKASQGRVNIEGSNVVAEEGLKLQAQAIEMKEARNTYSQTDFYEKKESGFLKNLNGRGIGFSIGSKKEAQLNANTQHSVTPSQVGSLKGKVELKAKETYRQSGSVVNAIEGDVEIEANAIEVVAGNAFFENNLKKSVEQKGLTFGVTSPLVSTIQTAEDFFQSTGRMGQSQSNTIDTFAALNAASDAYRVITGIYPMVKGWNAVKTSIKQLLNPQLSAQLTYGEQKDETILHAQGKRLMPSQIHAQGEVKLSATGNKENEGNILIQSSFIAGEKTTLLSAQNNILVTADKEWDEEESQHKTEGFNVGLSASLGATTATPMTFGVTLGGNEGKGYSKGQSTHWVKSQIGTINSPTQIKAQGDVEVVGSSIDGEKVELEAQNLRVESVQDTANFHGEEKKISGQITLGYGVSVSGGFNQSQTRMEYKSVGEQAGIFAGEEGYSIKVAEQIALKGAAILSAAEKDKNQLSAQDFVYSNLNNYSSAQASSNGLMGGVSFGRDQRTEEEKKTINSDPKPGETYDESNPAQNHKIFMKFGLTENDVHSADKYALLKLGLANGLAHAKEGEHTESTTLSVVSDGNFAIGSKTGEENLKGIQKSTQMQTQRLEKIDHEKMEENVKRDVSTFQKFAKTAAIYTDEAYRSQFVAPHRMMTFLIGEDGKPVKDPEREALLEKMAKEDYKEDKENGTLKSPDETEEEYIKRYKDENPRKINIYKLRELSDEERANLKKVTYFDPLTGKTDSKYFVAFNGMVNNIQEAAAYAVQHYIAQIGNDNPEKASGRIYEGIHFCTIHLQIIFFQSRWLRFTKNSLKAILVAWAIPPFKPKT